MHSTGKVAGTRGYLERIAYQLNASYDHYLYDCCAVMCRRILETLIIEIYEKELKERSRRFLVVKKMRGRRYLDTELMLERDKLFSA